MSCLKVLIVSGALAGGMFAQMQDPRAVIDRTQNDLRRAEDFERQNHKEVSRYEKAEKDLSDFDRDFTRGHFDKGKMNDSVNDLKNVVEHSTLNPPDRDALNADLRQLRMLKAER